MSAPKFKMISELSVAEIKDFLKCLNHEDVRIHIFKFLHDIHKAFKLQKKSTADFPDVK